MFARLHSCTQQLFFSLHMHFYIVYETFYKDFCCSNLFASWVKEVHNQSEWGMIHGHIFFGGGGLFAINNDFTL